MTTLFTPKQADALLADPETFHRTLKLGVKEDFPLIVEGLPDNLIDDMLDHGINQAKAYGLTEPRDLACFVYFMFEFAPQFYLHPYMQAILTSTKLAHHQKMTQVKQAPEQVWEEICQSILQQTWFPNAIGVKHG